MDNKDVYFRCSICIKEYSSYKSLWNHNKKFHCDYNISNSKPTHSNSTSTQNNSKIEDGYICNYCNKKYSRVDNLTRHKKTCKDKPTIKEENISLIEENKLMKQQINELKNQFALILKEKGRMHPKTLQKINKQLNIINNNNSVTNNTYVTFPYLDYSKIFSSSQIKSILNKQYMSLEESIKQVHFNDNLPEYSNLYITNMRDDLAYIFNGKEFIAVKKNSMLNELVDIHINEINLSLEKHRKKLDERVIDTLEKFLNKLNDEYTKMTDYNTDKTYTNYKAYKIDSIKLMIYNESDKNKLELLRSMQLEEKTYEEPESDEEITI
jgi:hypothetical protein